MSNVEAKKTLYIIPLKCYSRFVHEDNKKVSVIQCKKGNKESGNSTSCIMQRICILRCMTRDCTEERMGNAVVPGLMLPQTSPHNVTSRPKCSHTRFDLQIGRFTNRNVVVVAELFSLYKHYGC